MNPGKDYIGIGTGIALLNDKNEVLLMKRGGDAKNERNYWTLPGGKVDFGETLKDAVIREAKEELGVNVEVTDQLPAHDHILPEEGQHWVTNVFLGKITSGEPVICEPHKCEEIEWFSLVTLPSPIGKMSQGALEYLKSKML